MDFTTTALLASIRRRAMLSSAASAGTADADLLQLANEVLQNVVCPVVAGLREEFFLWDKEHSLVAGTAAYRISPRAMGAKLREVAIVSGGRVRNLVRISQDDLEEWSSDSGTPQAFYLKGNSVVLVPTPGASGDTLRLTHHQRPNELTNTAADYKAITVVDTGTSTVTVSSSTGLTSVAVDFVCGTSGFEWLAIDQAATGSTGTTLTFSSLPSGLAVGDYVCVAQKSPFPQVPADFHPWLVQEVACQVLENKGDTEGAAVARRKADALRDVAIQTLTPRVDGEPKIAAPGAHGLLGGIGYGGPDWW